MSDQEKTLHMTILMTPDMANFSGKVHGGALLKLLDQVAFACAARYCKCYVVTVSLDQVSFKNPINVGELVSFRANVNYVGTSSMEIGVKVIAEDLHSKKKRHTNSCYFTMVSMGEDGKPIKAPPLELKTDFERKLYEAALMRKKMREEITRRNLEITSGIEDYNKDVVE
ncbi:MAG: acyl-CoA thioesterase [Gammaproteobacteria bacterium]|nr:acyl-CoA thioesterase [Gammaproteobacteria bacterium]NIN61435.1 acyl-CoA thioesterase [Gammaproteobacteria bacterium]NIO61202.1 acyl-CoA thioesterase [Gammaproteobacteria bacterium]NIP48864.1 acyl-CoA thioesterase [Gammaproteobacteria bacterium]NIQ09318.1 acyl-CoA thioesterase [Gammaproteobacteria bacterium]